MDWWMYLLVGAPSLAITIWLVIRAGKVNKKLEEYKTNLNEKLAEFKISKEHLEKEKRELINNILNHFWDLHKKINNMSAAQLEKAKEKFLKLKQQSILLLPDELVFIFNAQNRYAFTNTKDTNSKMIIMALFSLLLKHSRMELGYENTSIKTKDLLELWINKLEQLDDVYIEKAVRLVEQEKARYKHLVE